MNVEWKGNLYGSKGNIFDGLKVLVLGESIHDRDQEVGTVAENHNQTLMQEYKDRAPALGADNPYRWLRTFDNMAWAIAGKGPDDLTLNGKRGEFGIWESTAFYNYVPFVVADSSRQPPTKKQFADSKSRDGFETVLQRLSPDVVICWGFNLFGWVIRNHYPGYVEGPWDFKGGWIDLPRSPKIRIVRMMHPSAAYSHARWHKVIKESIETYERSEDSRLLG